jgi:hypothetical protein
MHEVSPSHAPTLTEKAQAFIRELGLITKGARFHPDSTADVPQVIVDLNMEFLDSFALLDAYSKGAGGKVSQYDWIDAPYNLGEARFSFSGNRSLLLVSAAGMCICAVRNNDNPF